MASNVKGAAPGGFEARKAVSCIASFAGKGATGAVPHKACRRKRASSRATHKLDAICLTKRNAVCCAFIYESPRITHIIRR